jgi:hypothetical protein
MVKSARLNRDTFLALKEDSTATRQALIVLALAGASFGVGFAASIGYSAIGILLGAVFGAVVSIALSRPGLPHHVDPRIANPRRCTRDRRGLDSDFDSDRSEDRYGIGYST